MNASEVFQFRYLLNLEYLDGYNGGGLQMFAQKPIIFNPCIPQKPGLTISFHWVIQTKGSFVVVAPHPYQDGFNSGYNVASAVKHADNSWYDYTRSVAKIPITTRMPAQTGILFEFQLWIEIMNL